MNILICSVGRRVYLIDWFEDALRRAGILGQVHVTDADAHSAGMLHSANPHVVPPYAEIEYERSMLALVEELCPELLISVNDFELDRMADEAYRSALTSHCRHVLGLDPSKQHLASDKLLMSAVLQQHGIPAPHSVAGDDQESLARLMEEYDTFVIKDRFGSGSSGLQFVGREDLGETLTRIASQRTKNGVVSHDEALSSVVIQPAVAGVEYGVDIVCPLGSAEAGFATVPSPTPGVLARRKVRMRGGETDQACTVDPAPFISIGQSLARLLRPSGIIDVDIIVDDDGDMQVIDINPRFGGGYPFVHAAGADVPYALVAQAAGIAGADKAWNHALTYAPDRYGAKYQAVTSDGGAFEASEEDL